MSVQLAHHRFTRDEYHQMAKTGILKPDARVELIDGLIVEKPRASRRRIGTVDRLNRDFIEQVRDEAIVRTRGSIVLDDYSEPEPDIALLRRRDDFYLEVDATAEAVLLIVEVADTSEAYDRRTRVPLYVRVRIPEVWLADLNAGRVTIYRDPGPSGYATTRDARRGETISPLAFPDLIIAVEDVVG